MEKNKKKKVIITSTLSSILAAGTILGLTSTLSSCKKAEDEKETVNLSKPVFKEEHIEQNKEVLPTGNTNTFSLKGNNLKKLNRVNEKKKISVVSKNGSKVKQAKFSLTVKNDDELLINVDSTFRTETTLYCYYEDQLIGTMNYKPYPVFHENHGPVMANTKFDADFELSGVNFNLLNNDLTIKDEKNNDIEFDSIVNTTGTKIKISIKTKIRGHATLSCYYKDYLGNNTKVATLSYAEPRPVWLSDFIDNWRVNDSEQIDKNAKFPQETKYIELNETFRELKVAQNIFRNSKQFRDIEAEDKTKLKEFSKIIAVEKIKSIWGNDYDSKYDLLFNIKDEKDDFYISCQINEKGALDNLTEDDKIEIPFEAFKFHFDFKNARLDMDQNDRLFFSGIKTNAKFEYQGKIYEKDNFLDFNNEIRVLNSKVNGIIQKNEIGRTVREWNTQKLGNQQFVDSLKPKINQQINKNVNIFKYFADMIQKIGDLLSANKTIKEFLYGLREPICEFLTLADAHPIFVEFIDTILKEKAKIGLELAPAKGTYFWYLKKLRDLGIITGGLYTAINGLFGLLFIQNKLLIEWLLTLDKDLVNQAITTVGNKLGDKYKTLFAEILNFLSKLREISPNNNIADLGILDSIANSKMKDQLLNVFNGVFIAVLGADKAKKLTKLKPLWKEIGWNVRNLQGIFKGIFYPTVDGKEIKLSEYFKNNVKLVTLSEDVKKNNDNQTFSVNSTYRLEFTGNLKVSLVSLCTMLNDIKLSTVAKLLGKDLGKLGSLIANHIGQLRKALPDYISLNPEDYVEFKVQDDKAFLVPHKNGYSVKAKQTFQANFIESLDDTFKLLLKKWTFIGDIIIKIELNPYIKALKKYYMKVNYWTNMCNGVIKDEVNGLPNNNTMYDGQNYLNLTPDRAQRIKDLVKPHVEKFIATPNMDATFELRDHNIKREVFRILGLDENVNYDLVKFVFNMTPGFKEKVSSKNKPPFTNVDLNVDLGQSLLGINDFGDVVWINAFEVKNIRNQ